MHVVTRLIRAVGSAAFLLLLVLMSCSDAPTIDQRLAERRRVFPAREPLAGVRDVRLTPATAMYAAAELLRGTADYYSRFPDLGFTDVSSEQEHAITFDAMWLARYNVEMLDWISGMGIPLPSAEARVAACLRASGAASTPVRNLLPIYLPYVAGDPHFTRKVDLGDPNTNVPLDAATLRFDPARMERRLRPDAVAMTLWAEIELARVLLAPTHAIDESGAQVRPGKTREDLFEGLLLLTLASEKARALTASLGFMGRFPQPYYDIRYWPHSLSVAEPREGAELVVSLSEPESHLFDLAAILLAAAELAEISDPKSKSPFAAFLSASGVMPADTHELAQDLARTALDTILRVHDSATTKAPVSFVSSEERGTRLRVADAALLTVALQSYRTHVEGGSPFVESLERKLYAFLLAGQYFDGCYTASYDIETVNATEPRIFSAAVQGLAIRGLMVAFQSTGDFAYRRAAVRTQRYLDSQLWILDQKLYRSEEVIASGTKFSRYTPTLVGAVAGGLRELSLGTRDESYATRYSDFVMGVTRSGLLLSELAVTGEKSSDKEDEDSDGILNAPAADGPFGVAPVFAAEVVKLLP